jgi:hypothetical protein
LARLTNAAVTYLFLKVSVFKYPKDAGERLSGTLN